MDEDPLRDDAPRPPLPPAPPLEYFAPRVAPPPVPPQLEYFSPHDPEHRRQRGAAAWTIVLLASWLPYLCGVVNAATVARSYTPEIIREHRNGAVLLFAAGLILSITSLIGFARMRHLAGSLAAAAVVAVQLSLVMCLGLAT